MKKGLKEIVFIIDRSIAMCGLDDAVVREFNFMLKEQQALEGEALVTTVLFNDRYELFHDRIEIRAAEYLTGEDYAVRRNAALLDAIGKSMHKFRKVRYGTKEEFRAEKVLFIIITGSVDNASSGYTEEMIRQRITYREQKYGWEFVFFGANMDAAAEAGKIGIAANRAKGYSADAAGIRTAFAAVSSILTAFRKDSFSSCEENKVIGKHDDDIAQQAADDLISKFNAARNVTFTFEELLRNSYKQAEDSAKETLRNHLGSNIVFTGTWAETADVRELEEEELLEGELSASVFTIGCYAVRIAECLYVEDDSIGVHFRERVPAGSDKIIECQNEHKRIIQAAADGYEFTEGISTMEDGVRVVTEVSAMYSYGSEASVNCWHNICMAARSFRWAESIDYICTVKRDDTIPDGQAALFVLNKYVGDSFGIEHWYRFTPDCQVKEYRISGYGGQVDTGAWEL